MRWSLPIGRYLGIAVYVHWTFSLLLIYILYRYLSIGAGWMAALGGMGFVLAVFFCVLLHEYGHAIAARRYGVATRDITLLPIGGLARLERMPEHPREEAIVAIAGPMVNVVIAAVLGVIVLATGAFPTMMSDLVAPGSALLAQLMVVNLLLVVFNMIPAFPMDGGRVLRALLATRMPRVRATRIAGSIGQMMAILIATFGLIVLHNPFMLLIAIFVYLGAQSETEYVEARDSLEGMTAGDGMINDFHALPAETRMIDAASLMTSGSQTEFPVLDDDGNLRGLISSTEVVRALAAGREAAPVSGDMRTNPVIVDPSDPLGPLLESVHGDQGAAVVVREGQVVGLVTPGNVGELVMIRRALKAAKDRISTGVG
ncbi:MAG: site-2 protease family protein [Phycisphaerales bacterium]